jgi:tripartite-type tricarboxylate transporter receptor subunit TctC
MSLNSEINRRSILAGLGAVALPGSVVFADELDYPTKPIELVVPASAGGGTDAVSRAFSEAVKKYLSQPVTVNDKPGASGAIGMADMINAKPDGYKICMVIVEITILPSLGLTKYTYEDFIPIAQLNADPAAITVRADAPWNTIEEFLADAQKSPGNIKMGNSGNGSIWHLAHASLEDKVGVKFNPIPFQGAAPAVVALLGGHIDAVSVSPGEVSAQVAGGKLKTLAVMSDQRVKGFERVPTLKERKIDLSIGAWRGLAAPKGTPVQVVNALRAAAKSAAAEPMFKESLDKLNLGMVYADADSFRQLMQRDSDMFKKLIAKLGLKAST